MVFLLPVPAKWVSKLRGDHESLKSIDGHHDHGVGGQEKIWNSIYFIMVTF